MLREPAVSCAGDSPKSPKLFTASAESPAGVESPGNRSPVSGEAAREAAWAASSCRSSSASRARSRASWARDLSFGNRSRRKSRSAARRAVSRSPSRTARAKGDSAAPSRPSEGLDALSLSSSPCVPSISRRRASALASCLVAAVSSASAARPIAWSGVNAGGLPSAVASSSRCKSRRDASCSSDACGRSREVSATACTASSRRCATSLAWAMVL